MLDLSMNVLTWVGIAFCITQSAIFSGLNLALLGISRLRLEVEATANNHEAIKILTLRKDFNFLLTTILWGNVSINVLLTLLSNSVMAGLTAFIFSTFLITFLGEITPQAYFSRHAMRMGALLAPLIRVYQVILYPVAKPSGIILDWWLGKEGISYFRESDLRTVIRKHIEAEESDIDRLEGIGAVNFLALDDIKVTQEGENIDPASIITLPAKEDKPVFPEFERKPDDPFLLSLNRSGKKWVIIVDDNNQPFMVLNANAFLRDSVFGETPFNPFSYCHRPIIVTDAKTLLGNVMAKLKVYPKSDVDDVIDDDLILIWTDDKRVITGADILGRLLRGIALRDLSPG
ncbi:MAG: CNNM domain-containing protein [Gammaproteobacteria bacterium]|nr:CNNM domain-containing protein [Gammaproteobacteria bacterium]MCW8986557.1 CNNM domain-containing protein [Gammaproteobacteria bacterium]MCW9031920.1 CNNM domain-containing protein [Gammaproteobacteria bacterium]